jgi:hypothetical protein
MLKYLSFLLPLFCCFASDAQEVSKKNFSIGEVLTFESDVLSEERTVNVYLPASYHPDSNRLYPVIYLLDGSRDEDFIHIAGLVQFCSFSWIDILPESIVVGIGNVDRKRDFTFPTTIEQDKKDFPTTGASASFMQFIELELQPIVEKTYKTAASKTIIGQSLGGLLATEILFKKPSLFDHYIIISPSLWWDDQSLLSHPVSHSLKEKSIYVGVGKEGEIMERDARSLYELLGKQDTQQLHFGFFEKQDHGDVLHLAVYDSFEKLFKK